MGDFDQIGINIKLCLIFRSLCRVCTQALRSILVLSFRKRGDFDQLGVNIKLCLISKSFCQAFRQKEKT